MAQASLPPSSFRDAPVAFSVVIPGGAQREPGIHWAAMIAVGWIPGSRRFASRPGMTRCGDFCPTGKSVKSCLAQVAKIYRFAFDPKHLYKPRRLVPSQRGVSWSSRNVGAGCDGRRRYRKTSGTDADGKAVWSWRPTLASSPLEFIHRATVANKPDHRGERGISRKPLRRGCPGASAEPVCSCAPLLLCV